MGEVTISKKGHITDSLGIRVIQDGSSVKEIVTTIKFIENEVSKPNKPIVIEFYGLLVGLVIFDQPITYNSTASCGKKGLKIVQSFTWMNLKDQEIKFEGIFHDPHDRKKISKEDLISLLYTLDVG